jgi:carbon monoxide dehydrogenase subunit G
MAGKLEFGGEELFRSPPEKLFAAMTDVRQIAECIPDLTSSNVVDDQTLECVVRPGFSFLRGTLKVKIRIDELDPPRHATSRVESSGIGQTIRLVSQMDISPDDSQSTGGSKLTWRAEVTELKGLVATISPALINGAADQVIRQSWAQIRAKLGEA